MKTSAFTLHLLLALWVTILPVTASAAPPNIVLIMTDDQGYGDLGCHGNTMIRTPNLDRLHSQSVRLTDFHVDPTCSPTRASLLTGRYSTKTGVWHTIMGRSLIHADEVTLADYLSQAGYQTGMFGKWHLGDNYPMRPQDKGFKETVAHGGGGITQTPDFWGNDYFDDTYWHNGKPKAYKGYCTDVFFDAAMKFISKNRRKPFFVYLPTNVPHGPFNVADHYRDYYTARGVAGNVARFYGMIENFDENMGRLMAHLKKLDLEDNTILIFMTDNGTAAGAPRNPGQPGGWKGFNAGMRAQKGSHYDGGHRVPFFVRWPAGGIQGGKDVGTLAAHIDVLPTLLDLCGLPAPARKPVDGRSLAPLLRNPNADWEERTLVVHSQRIESPEKWRRCAVMTEQWRLIDGKELYDIQKDPGQRSDVSDQHPEVVSQLREVYEGWWKDLEPRFDQHAWIVIGAREENPAHITCHDWHGNQVPWNQGMIKRLPKANGYWMVKVDRAGTYAFTLRHRPKTADFPLNATEARVRVGEIEATAAIPKGQSSVTLKLKLQPGQYKMQTWLEDKDSGESRGAFFVDVKR